MDNKTGQTDKYLLELKSKKVSCWLSKKKAQKEKRQIDAKQALIKIQKKTTKKTKMSSTYEVPSAEKMLQEKNEIEKLKSQIREINEIEDVPLDISFTLNVSQNSKDKPVNPMDCKHLTPQQLTEYFNENKEYLLKIIQGKIYSSRHERFHNYNPAHQLTLKDLTYNTSIVVYSQEQIEVLMNLLSDAFDDGDGHMTQYFFQVLLPEICVKIFMEEHTMEYIEALRYLDTRPLE